MTDCVPRGFLLSISGLGVWVILLSEISLVQHPEEFGSATMGPGIYLERGIKACDRNIHGRGFFFTKKEIWSDIHDLAEQIQIYGMCIEPDRFYFSIYVVPFVGWCHLSLFLHRLDVVPFCCLTVLYKWHEDGMDGRVIVAPPLSRQPRW